MAMQDMNDFAESVRNDDSLAEGLSAALRGKYGKEAAKAFADYAEAHGFGVSALDVEAMTEASEHGRALSDDQLEAVSAGTLFNSIPLFSKLAVDGLFRTVREERRSGNPFFQ